MRVKNMFLLPSKGYPLWSQRASDLFLVWEIFLYKFIISSLFKDPHKGDISVLSLIPNPHNVQCQHAGDD